LALADVGDAGLLGYLEELREEVLPCVALDAAGGQLDVGVLERRHVCLVQGRQDQRAAFRNRFDLGGEPAHPEPILEQAVDAVQGAARPAGRDQERLTRGAQDVAVGAKRRAVGGGPRGRVIAQDDLVGTAGRLGVDDRQACPRDLAQVRLQLLGRVSL